MKTSDIILGLGKVLAIGTGSGFMIVGATEMAINGINYANPDESICSVESNFFRTTATFGLTFFAASVLYTIKTICDKRNKGGYMEDLPILLKEEPKSRFFS